MAIHVILCSVDLYIFTLKFGHLMVVQVIGFNERSCANGPVIYSLWSVLLLHYSHVGKHNRKRMERRKSTLHVLFVTCDAF